MVSSYDSQMYVLWTIGLLMMGLKDPICFTSLVLIATAATSGFAQMVRSKSFPWKTLIFFTSLLGIPALLLKFMGD